MARIQFDLFLNLLNFIPFTTYPSLTLDPVK